MAFSPQYIDVLNINPNIGIGIQIPFTNANVFASTYNTNEALKNNLINYFLTNPGELPMNPLFGAGLRSFLFNQSNENTFFNIESFIRSKLKKVFPSLQIKEINVSSTPGSENSIIIKLNYFVPNSSNNGVVTFNFNV